MRTFTNKPGVTYDENRTTVIYAEDMNEIAETLEELQTGGLGAQIYTGEGAASSELGNNGDLYIEIATGQVYKKITGEWADQGFSIKGDDGTDGTDGTDGDDGDTGPAGPANTVFSATDASTITFNIDTDGGMQSVTLGGNRTLAITCTNNRAFVLILKQDGTGTRVPTWFSGISWAGGSAPTLTTTANKTDTFGFIRTGSGAYLGFVIGQNS